MEDSTARIWIYSRYEYSMAVFNRDNDKDYKYCFNVYIGEIANVQD